MQILKEGTFTKLWKEGKAVCEVCGAELWIKPEDLVLDGLAYHAYCPFCDTTVASFKEEALPAECLGEIRALAKQNRYARATSNWDKMQVWMEFLMNEHTFLFMLLVTFCVIAPLYLAVYASLPIGLFLEVLMIVGIFTLISD